MHDAGYIHRDIDPSNIMLTTDGHIKLIDFGIAKQMTSLTNNDRSFTTTGKFIGKAKYAAPEQVTGDIAHQNKTTDIYSIGILFYQLVCGHLPFNGPDHEVMQMQINKSLPLKEIQDKTIRNIIKRATEKNQQKRFQSASEFRVALDNPSKSRKAPASFTVIITIMAILGIALGVLLGFLL
jgi:serine/threonine-protein kinase